MSTRLALAGIVLAATFAAACGSSNSSPVNPSPLAGSGQASDTVSSPPGRSSAQTITQIAVGNPSFSTLVLALSKAGLAGMFDGSPNYTVFAPTNDAFDAAARAFGYADGPALVAALDVETLTSILSYHVTRGSRNATSVVAAGQLRMLDGNRARITSDGDVMIENARITATNVRASNGYIHVIDAVLLPPALR